MYISIARWISIMDNILYVLGGVLIIGSIPFCFSKDNKKVRIGAVLVVIGTGILFVL